MESSRTLKDLAFRCIVDKLTVILCDANYHLKPHIALPANICHELFDRLLKAYLDEMDDRQSSGTPGWLSLFLDTERTRLHAVRLRNVPVLLPTIKFLLRHPLREFDARGNSTSFQIQLIKMIQESACPLVDLYFGACEDDIYEKLIDNEALRDSFPITLFPSSSLLKMPDSSTCYLNKPNLRSLTLHNLHLSSFEYYRVLLSGLTQLSYLDLSGCGNLGNLSYLANLPNLKSLILYNIDVNQIQSNLKNIMALKSLRFLDISQSSERDMRFERPTLTLARLILHLPNLTGLDISGTNLAGVEQFKAVEERAYIRKNLVADDDLIEIPDDSECVESSIAGLLVLKKPLEFLGIVNCQDHPSTRASLPAKKIAGESVEKFVLVSLQMYTERHDLILVVLHEVFNLLRIYNVENAYAALEAILKSMKFHIDTADIQISGSASLFHILKMSDKIGLNLSKRREILRILIKSMEIHRTDRTLIRNGCLTLCYFKIPQDMLCDYVRVMKILLHIVQDHRHEIFVTRLSLHLLNSLACQVDGDYKMCASKLSAIEIILKIIEKRVTEGICDEVLEVAWSFLWNITDETPTNCEAFVNGGGLQLFRKCIENYPDKDELHRNVMGLMGNVAEVAPLRTSLLYEEYLTVICSLLGSKADGIEVAYNACGVMSHIASDGEKIWKEHSNLDRNIILNRMVEYVEKWDISANRNINYRSFEPILRLIPCHHTPPVQHWACWALANLTTVYRDKYCGLLKQEGGDQLLRALIDHPEPSARLKELAGIVLTNMERYEKEKGLDRVEPMSTT